MDDSERNAIDVTLEDISGRGPLLIAQDEPFFKDMFAAYLQLLQEEPGMRDLHTRGCEIWYDLFDERID